MKVPIYGLRGEDKGNIEVADTFSIKVNTELIKKAFLAEQSMNRQPYGSDPVAGMRSSAHYHGRRHSEHSMMNREMARMKRIHGSGHLSFRARTVPQATKGRKAHPPKIERNWKEKINKKERMNAMLSAISASVQKEMLNNRGHKIDNIKTIPLIVIDDLEKIKKTKDVLAFFEAFGLKKELKRLKEKKVRRGKGTFRGRKYKRKKGLLIVIKKDEGICKAARNMAGVDVVESGNLRVEHLAPGAYPGRLCIWTKSAVEDIINLKLIGNKE